jgi:hypothetical protein
MTWILLIWLMLPDHNVSVLSHEFNSREACNNAGEEISKKSSIHWTYTHYVCVPKDTLAPIR